MSLIGLLAESAADAHGGEAGNAFPPFESWHFPSQLFWLAITFGGLYLVLSRTILPRLGANLERRSDTIADDLDEAARLDEQASDARVELEKRITQARVKARQTAADAEASMAEEIAVETQRVDAEIESKLEAAEARIAELRTEAMSNVQEVAGEATKAIVARLGSKATAASVKKAVAAAVNAKG
ncbi:MAG: hypothetical protein AAGJ29_03825 [Pseudomonadota bacterium]